MNRRWKSWPILLLATWVAFASNTSRAEPREDSKTISLFDGESFKGWEGNLGAFRIEDGAIVGGSLDVEVPRNEFLCTKEEFSDFELRLKFKVLGKGANAGVQIRTRRIPNHHEVIGYQADLGDGYWGCLYDESRRKTILAQADAEETEKNLKRDDWNDYRIRCEGRRIRLWINDYPTVDYTEEDESIEQSGLIAVQIHGGPPSEAWYKDITLEKLDFTSENAAAGRDAAASTLKLKSRRRVRDSAEGEFRLTFEDLAWNPSETAIVVCDMWDKHWCRGATKRVAEMAPRMNEVLKVARQAGVLIIHCPSSCLDPYKDSPQRKLAEQAPAIATKIPLAGWSHLDPSHEGPLPIDDSDNGCDCEPRCEHGAPWKKQIDLLEIGPNDAITDSAEAYYLMRGRGVKNVIVMGVHVNMCVLGRPFSIRQMVNQGLNVVLTRDMTDSMYNSRMAPYVEHCRGTELVVEHIEKYWCPTITSSDFTGQAEFHFAEDKRPRAVFVIGEDEYETNRTLPAFFAEELEHRGVSASFVFSSPDNPNDFSGLEALDGADVMVLSVRRRTPRVEQLERIKSYLAAGKPLVGIRTASHAFSLREGAPPPGYAAWPEFDAEILGGNYQGHHGNKGGDDPKTFAWVEPKMAGHPILKGVEPGEFEVRSWLYKTSPLARSATLLMMGRVQEREPPEPVTWTNSKENRRVFYTSLGHPDDFRLPRFRRLLLNSVFWALERDVPEPVAPLAKAPAKN